MDRETFFRHQVHIEPENIPKILEGYKVLVGHGEHPTHWRQSVDAVAPLGKRRQELSNGYVHITMKCQECHRRFEPARSDATTCSSRCRQKAYRRRLAVTRKATGSVTDNAHWFSSLTDEWETPKWLFDELDREFHFTLDVCASPQNAKCAKFYTPSDNGLSQPWQGICWMNPPYGRTIGLWIAKAYNSAQAGATIVALVPARTDTAWWQDYVAKIPDIRYLRGRLRFGSAKSNAPFPSVVAIFKPNGNVSN